MCNVPIITPHNVYLQSTVQQTIDHFPIIASVNVQKQFSFFYFVVFFASFQFTQITKNVPFSRLHCCCNVKFTILENVNWEVCHEVNKNWFLLIRFQFFRVVHSLNGQIWLVYFILKFSVHIKFIVFICCDSFSIFLFYGFTFILCLQCSILTQKCVSKSIKWL